MIEVSYDERNLDVQGIQGWTAEDHLAFMEKNNVSKSILSCSSPGIHLIPGDDAFEWWEVTREVNEYAADLKRKHPTKLGFFASLPLPDIASSLLEIDYGLDHLDVDGFIFLSNYHGMDLGDLQLAPIYAKLQARKATVLVHPTAPCTRACNHSAPTTKRMLKSAPLADAYMIPMMEFFFDSTHTFVDLLLSGTPRCDLRGPALRDRAPQRPRSRVHVLCMGYEREVFEKQFYFDLAGVSMPSQIHHMLRRIKSDRIVYGSDVPFTAWTGAERLLQAIETELPKLFGEQEI
ncbi:hypothetical protein B0H17DRAFT_1185186 [Mycena rosella]|uniref:6-methylsalicylate decarboxylase n=1 Tax=Mycena rosella TaxID=1033263 RepID=A0AAD7CSZ6_MYCRO|nr:hypothetical protein B0H17DRAFT_1185186 [Mycena rosella]